ncbi:MAG: hypothetical protein ACPGU1_21545 [Myxococcota bacterium]
MSAALQDALARGLDWLDDLGGPPGLEARAEGQSIECEAPYAVALVSSAWRYAAVLRRPQAPIDDWLASCCDADGMVRFFGPHSAVIGPDLDDTALVWAERRALTGWSPPKEVTTATQASQLPDGAFNTWPSPPESGPALEVDAVVNANIVAMLAADGQTAPSAITWVQRALSRIGTPSPPVCPYYPDLAMLALCALRAEGLGAPMFSYPSPEAFDGSSHLGQVTRSLLGDEGATAALLAEQEEDGSWPWAPLFIGGEENQFPDGRHLRRPWYGGRAASTALAVWALARRLDLVPAHTAPARGPLPVRRAPREPWEAMVGPIEHGVSLRRREQASRAIPELESPEGTLRLDIATRAAMPRFFRAGAHWALGYRGSRTPNPVEVSAIERLLARLDDEGPPPEPSEGPARIQCHAPDASDLGPRLQATSAPSGPLHVSLPLTLDVPSALPHLADALRSAQGDGPELRFEGLPHCALPWPEEITCGVGPDDPRRPLGQDCTRCTDAHRCAGPAGGVLRPRTSSGPWVPLRRAAAAWRDRWGHPAPDVFAPLEEALHDLQGGPLAGVRWSIVVVADVSQGRVDPTFRVDAFHGFREGRVVPGRAVLERLQMLTPSVRAALEPAANACPIHPAFGAGPSGAQLGAYADTGHLTPEGAWATFTAGLKAIGLTAPAHPAPELSVLGYAVAPGPATPRLDVYITVPPTHRGELQPPLEVAQHASGRATVATLRLEGGALHLRKWDLPWWPSGRDDDALLDTLAIADDARQDLASWLHAPGYSLRPTTMGWREGGRRIYLRVC